MTGVPLDSGGGFGSGIVYLERATFGGNGSFSYGDTSHYGPRMVATRDPVTGAIIFPGTGGGAKSIPPQQRGSAGPYGNRNGIVLIRLSKLS